MWQHPDQREDWLRKVTFDDPASQEHSANARIEALKELRSFAAQERFRDSLWKDGLVRDSLLKCTALDQADDVKALALGVLNKLSLSGDIRRQMFGHEQTRQALYACMDQDAPFGVRRIAYVLLSNMMLFETRRSDAVSREVLKTLADGSGKRMPTDIRSRILGALWSMATTGASLPELWANLDLRFTLIAALPPSEPGEVRANALGFLWALSASSQNWEPIWADERVRQGLLTCLAAEQPEAGEGSPMVSTPSTVRVHACYTVRSLSAAETLREALWEEKLVQRGLLQGTSKANPRELRSAALHALLALALGWQARSDVRLRAALSQASEDLRLEPRDRTACLHMSERLAGM